MNSYPFNQNCKAHALHLQEALFALDVFADLYPHLHPWIISPITVSVYFPATAADQLRDTFGREGWVIENRIIWRMEGPVRVEMGLPQSIPNPQPFTL